MFIRYCRYSETHNPEVISVYAENGTKMNELVLDEIANLPFLCRLNDDSVFVSKIKYVEDKRSYCVEHNTADYIADPYVPLAEVKELCVVVTSPDTYKLLFYGK
jgi:hypothetical protein